MKTWINMRQICPSCGRPFPLKKMSQIHCGKKKCSKDYAALFPVFHMRNPEVFEALMEMALEVYESGAQQHGVKALYNRLRYDSEGNQVFHLPDQYHSFYARLLIEHEPKLAEIFKLKKQRCLERN